MLPSFNPVELQERFCEGFSFHPFQSLEQYGHFIYKCYAAAGDIKPVLDLHSQEYDFNSNHPSLLIKKLHQRDLPCSGKLLDQLRSSASMSKQRPRCRKQQEAIHTQLVEVMDTYMKMLEIYRQNVLQFVATQMLPPATADDDDGYFEEIGPETLQQLQKIIREFLHRSDVIWAFLTGCVQKAPGFEKLMLTEEEKGSLKELADIIALLAEQQAKTIQILENWRKHRMHFNNRQLQN